VSTQSGDRGETSTNTRDSRGAGTLDPAESIKARLRLLRSSEREQRERRAPISDEPCCAYGLVTRTKLESLAQDIEEIKSRVNALLWSVGGAVLLDVVTRLVGR
jgi:hypothetical protein